MNKIVTSIALASTLASSLAAADTFGGMFEEAKLNAQLRAFYINRASTGLTAFTDRSATAIGGKIGFKTGELAGLSFGATYFGSEVIKSLTPTNYAAIDPTLMGENKASYSFLGEAFINYKLDKTNIKLGKQEIATPLAGGDDARMVPTVFNGIVATNSNIDGVTLVAAHLTDIADGSFSNAYAGGQLALVSGYGLETASSGSFVNMGSHVLGLGNDTLGVTAVAAVYKNDILSAQVWDYYAYNLINAVYADANLNWTCLLSDAVKMSASGQAIAEQGISSSVPTSGLYVAGKVGAKVAGATLNAAYSMTGSKNVVSPWGGMPAYTQGMVTRHQFFADTTALRVDASYNIKELTGVNLTALVAYSQFVIASATNGYTTASTASEPFFDLTYVTDIKGMSFKFRGNFPTNFKYASATSTTGWNEYRAIMYYNF